jgi:ABC-2 type transport system permease protein
VAELLRVWQASGVLFRRGVQGRLVYARYFFLDMAAMLINFGLTLCIWLYVDDQRGHSLAVPRDTLIAYMTLATVVNFGLSMWIDGILGARIRSGQVATDLLKPLNFQWLYFASAMADVAIQLGMGAAVLGLAFVLLEQPPLALEWQRMLVFILSLGLATLVQYGLTFLVGLTTFVTHNGYGAFYIRLMSHLAFSGVFAPLALYPAGLRAVADVLPFQHMVHTPVAIGMGLLPLDQAPHLLLQQLLWAIGLLALGQWAYRRIMGNLSIQGG